MSFHNPPLIPLMKISTDPIHIHQMWEKLAKELSQIFDTHGVCIAIAQEMSKFTDTAVVIGLSEPNSRYYDIWISYPDGKLTQNRWTEHREYLDTLILEGDIQLLSKTAQPPQDLIDNPLWLLPEERLLVLPLPYPINGRHDMITQGIIAFIDPEFDNTANPNDFASTAMFLTTYLERSSLHYQRDRQRVEFAITSEISQSLNSTLNLAEIFARVSDDIRRMLDVESLSLGLIDKETNNIVFVPELMGSMFMDIPPLELQQGQGVAGWVAVNKQPLIVNDAYRDRRFSNSSDDVSGFVTRSIVCVPLLQDDARVIGVMEAINKRNGGFTQHDKELLEALSGPLTAAILNAELHGDVVAEKRRIETIFQSMSEGALTTDPEGKITAINDSMLSLLGRSREDVLAQLATDFVHLKEGTLHTFLKDVLDYNVADIQIDYPQLACEIQQGE